MIEFAKSLSEIDDWFNIKLDGTTVTLEYKTESDKYVTAVMELVRYDMNQEIHGENGSYEEPLESWPK